MKNRKAMRFCKEIQNDFCQEHPGTPERRENFGRKKRKKERTWWRRERRGGGVGRYLQTGHQEPELLSNQPKTTQPKAKELISKYVVYACCFPVHLSLHL